MGLVLCGLDVLERGQLTLWRCSAADRDVHLAPISVSIFQAWWWCQHSTLSSPQTRPLEVLAWKSIAQTKANVKERWQSPPLISLCALQALART